MELNNWLSYLALLIAVLSAIYARRSVKEANKANRISLQFEKVEIYKEVLSFSESFIGLNSIPTEERLKQFKQKGVTLAELYFTHDIYEQLEIIHSYCRTKEMYLDVVRDNEENPSYPSERDLITEYKSIIDLLRVVIKEIKNDLRINA